MPSPDQAPNPLRIVDETIYASAVSLVLDQFGTSDKPEFDLDAASVGLASTFLEAHKIVESEGINIPPEHLDERFRVIGRLGFIDGVKACVDIANLQPQGFGQDAQA
ncbi:MAG: hypothetical protein AAB462_01235 [Patescibacteria group bacterium]